MHLWVYPCSCAGQSVHTFADSSSPDWPLHFFTPWSSKLLAHLRPQVPDTSPPTLPLHFLPSCLVCCNLVTLRLFCTEKAVWSLLYLPSKLWLTRPPLAEIVPITSSTPPWINSVLLDQVFGLPLLKIQPKPLSGHRDITWVGWGPVVFKNCPLGCHLLTLKRL